MSKLKVFIGEWLRPGLLSAIKGVLRIKPGGLLWLGVPCSLLVFMSIGTSLRGIQGFDMWGDVSLPSVQKSNQHLTRAFLLIALAIARSVYWCTEQPGTSRLTSVDPFKLLLGDDSIPTTMQRLSGPQRILFFWKCVLYLLVT